MVKDEVDLKNKGLSRGTTQAVSGRIAAVVLLHPKAPAGMELAWD